MKMSGVFWKPTPGERITQQLTQKIVREWEPIANLDWDEAMLMILGDEYGNVTVGYCDPMDGKWIDLLDEENPMEEPVWFMSLPEGKKGRPANAKI